MAPSGASYSIEGRKEGMGFLSRFQQLGSYRDETETRNCEEIPFSSRIVSSPCRSGHDAWLPSLRPQVRVSAGSLSGLAWSSYKCAALWGLSMVILQLRDPWELTIRDPIQKKTHTLLSLDIYHSC